MHFAHGAERFTELNESQIEHPDPGEVIFADETGLVVARRWCWRQSDESAAQVETTHAVITVEAHHTNGRADVQAALDDLLRLLAKYAGGHYTSALLGRDQPSI